jgi:phosphoribosylaminoimidazole-succinocarboxamide synthase
MKIVFKPKYLVKEAQLISDSEQIVANTEASEGKVTANSLRLLYQKIAEFGQDIMESKTKPEDLAVIESIEVAEKSVTVNQIEEARKRFEKQFQASQELVSK